MINDALFKSLQHSCKGYEMHCNGQTLEKGYRPDYVLKNDSQFIILESENATSRKTFVGGTMKAAHFLVGEKTGILIFITVPRKNATIKMIAAHLGKYLLWLQPLTNLRDVYVIDANAYYNTSNVMSIHSSKFRKAAIKV